MELIANMLQDCCEVQMTRRIVKCFFYVFLFIATNTRKAKEKLQYTTKQLLKGLVLKDPELFLARCRDHPFLTK